MMATLFAAGVLLLTMAISDPVRPPKRPPTPVNRHFWHTETTKPESANAIWHRWTTISAWPSFDDGLTSARLDDGSDDVSAVGQRGVLTDQTGRKVEFEISMLAPDTAYTFTSDLPLAKLHVHRFLRESGGSLAVTHEVWFSGPLGGLFARILGKKFRGQLPAVVRKVVVLAEAQTSK